MTEKIITTKDLTKIYKTFVDEVKVFENLNIEINKGSSVAIIGESGRGKTTLLNILSGLDKPTSGEVYFNGSRIDILSEEELSIFRNKYIGFVFQHHYLLDDFNALENVLLPLRIYNNKISDKDKNKALDLLSYVGLQKRIYHYPDQLSGGECQRVAIVRALINNPQLIFADEPTGSLDKKNSNIVSSLLWNLKNDFNITLVIATHNHELFNNCDYIINLG